MGLVETNKSQMERDQICQELARFINIYIYVYMGMEQIKNIPIWGDEYPFSSYFGLHQGCRILTDDPIGPISIFTTNVCQHWPAGTRKKGCNPATLPSNHFAENLTSKVTCCCSVSQCGISIPAYNVCFTWMIREISKSVSWKTNHFKPWKK